MSSSKVHSGVIGVRRSHFSIALSVGGLALFLILASLVLVLYPLSSSLQRYLLVLDRYREADPVYVYSDQTKGELLLPLDRPQDDHDSIFITKPSSNPDASTSSADDAEASTDGPMVKENLHTSSAHYRTKVVKSSDLPSPTSSNSSEKSVRQNYDNSYDLMSTFKPPSSSQREALIKVNSRSCDLYTGKWVFDPRAPLYTNNTCPVITQMQNCQGNGRPDKDYENWRWKPKGCNLPRFDARKFLELMRGKTLAFIGDSVARNHMESMLCILCCQFAIFQIETPKNRGNRKMHRWYFRSTSTTIVRIWSSWLVHKTSEPFQSIPTNVVKVHLDLPDENFMEHLSTFDVVVLSSGHWFAKQSAYILNGTIVGGQLWWPKEAGHMQINNIDAYGISVETCLTAIASHPKFTGLAVIRSYSPDHYEGGAWNTGGSCTGNVKPVPTVLRNWFTYTMHEKQLSVFKRALKKAKASSMLRFMDVTKPFEYRPDGHPGPYRSPDPNKVTKRGPNGEPPPQDCLHWCMPGPIDTWNEMLLEVIRRV